MKARIFVRVAKRSNFVAGERFKIAASHNRNDMPLYQGDKTLRTLHFAVDVEIPDEMFKEPSMPVVKVQVESDGTFRHDPVVVQVPIEVQPEGDLSVVPEP